jgi:acyl-CoA thioesterase
VTRFATDTAVVRYQAGRYRATIDRGWWIERGPNGGYLAAIVLRAVLAEVDDPERRLRTCTLHYLRPPVEGPCEVHVTVERAGRGLSTVSARLRQADRDCIIALVAVGADRPGPTVHDHPAPPAPDPEMLAGREDGGGPDIPMRVRYDTRPALGAPPFTQSDRALTGGWIRSAEDDPVDDVLVAAITDAWIPAIFSRLDDRLGVPTVELTIHFRNRPPLAPGWCLVQFETLEVVDGYLEESGAVWSRDGLLLAECRQLAVVVGQPTE